MGASDDAHEQALSTVCPNCGRTVYGASLRDLVRHMKTHTCSGAPTGRYTVRTSESRFVQLDLPLIFVFNRTVLSQNMTTYNHWRAYHKDKKDWQRHVHSSFNPYSNLKLEWSSWSLVRQYGGRNKRLDYANLVGGAKPLVDLLIHYGIIKDDRDSCFSCTYDQQPVDGQTSTVLSLLEVRDARYSTIIV